MIPIQWISAQLLSWTASQRATPSTQNSARGRRCPAMTGECEDGEVWGDALLLWILIYPDSSRCWNFESEAAFDQHGRADVQSSFERLCVNYVITLPELQMFSLHC